MSVSRGAAGAAVQTSPRKDTPPWQWATLGVGTHAETSTPVQLHESGQRAEPRWRPTHRHESTPSPKTGLASLHSGRWSARKREEPEHSRTGVKADMKPDPSVRLLTLPGRLRPPQVLLAPHQYWSDLASSHRRHSRSDGPRVHNVNFRFEIDFCTFACHASTQK